LAASLCSGTGCHPNQQRWQLHELHHSLLSLLLLLLLALLLLLDLQLLPVLL
jgi:hypothetical protein